MGQGENKSQDRTWVEKSTHILIHYIVPPAISLLLVVVFLREVNFHQVWQIVQHGCNMWVLVLVMAFSLLSVAIRGIRWGIQLRGVGIARMPPVAEISALWGAAALNIVFPRLGEAWRCVFVAHRQKCPLTTVVGTDLGDRTSDLICVFVFMGIALLIAHPALDNFARHYALGRALGHIFLNKWLWISLASVALAIWVLLRFFGQRAWVRSMRTGLLNIWDGFAILFHMDQLGLYLWLTLALWGASYLTTYVSLFAFPFTREWVLAPGMHYGLTIGFISLLFGILSTGIPSNGGLGPWTIAIAYSLEIFGMPHEHAVSYALVVWGAQTVSYIFGGIFAATQYFRHREETNGIGAKSRQ